MNAVVVYESVYGNSRAVAEAIAEGLGASALPVSEALAPATEADLLVVGGPTHMHGMTTERSRQMAIAAAHEDGGAAVDAHAGDGPGLRVWLRELPSVSKRKAACFDTRLDRSPWLTGVAARGIGRRLRGRGYDVLATESFLVEDAEGPLEDGELDRARAWGAHLAELQPTASGA
ncbi:MAG TPA: hypothetical protein VF706_06025 [Solirubrobacteraceae bacterium]